MQHVCGMEFVHNSEDQTTCKDYSAFIPVNVKIGDSSAVGNMTSCNWLSSIVALGPINTLPQLPSSSYGVRCDAAHPWNGGCSGI
jgi:hypothetical protein